MTRRVLLLVVALLLLFGCAKQNGVHITMRGYGDEIVVRNDQPSEQSFVLTLPPKSTAVINYQRLVR